MRNRKVEIERARVAGPIVCIAAMLAACAAGPGKVPLDAPGHVVTEFEIVDGRAAKARSPRTEGANYYLGEEHYAVSPLVVLKSGLQQAAGPALKGRRVVVTEFESFVHTRWKGPAPPGGSVPGMAGVGVVANILSAGLIYGFESARADRLACTHINVDIDGQRYIADDCEPAGMTGQEVVLRRVIISTIAKLGANIAGRPPGSPSSPGN